MAMTERDFQDIQFALKALKNSNVLHSVQGNYKMLLAEIERLQSELANAKDALAILNHRLMPLIRTGKIYTLCENCGNPVVADSDHEVSGDGSHVCDNCREDHVRECSTCEKDYIVQDMHFVGSTKQGDVYVCDFCYEPELNQEDVAEIKAERFWEALREEGLR